MDNDDYRRDKISNHKKFGEPVALLAGNALLTMAFEIMNKNLVSMVAKNIGAWGLLSGQVADILLKEKNLEKSSELITYIYRHKTALLIETSCLVGAQCSEASTAVLEGISAYGKNIGFAFQTIDDVFDNDPFSLYNNKEESFLSGKKNIENAKKSLAILQDHDRKRLFELADYVLKRTD